MSPNRVLHAEAPNMRHLIEQGTYTMHGRGVIPTVSSSNWASMIMGAGPEQHGVTSNGWEANEFIIMPTAVSTGGLSVCKRPMNRVAGTAMACFGARLLWSD